MSTTTTIATKDQERDALAKIKKIVEGLGPQSYLATAFEGCFQDAEDNIENDFAFSMASRYESEHEKAVHNEGVATEACRTTNAEKQKNAELQKQIEELDDALGQSHATAASLQDAASEQARIASDEKQRANAAELLVTELKAKLYDYMTA